MPCSSASRWPISSAGPLYVTDMIQQADLIGVGSLPIVILTGGFTGAVLALNSASTLSRFGRSR